MPRLTLRTLLAYIDDTLEPTQARSLGAKVAGSDSARELIERIKKVTRRRGLKSPIPEGRDDVADPNIVAEYLSDNLDSAQVKELEETCLKSDVHLAEVAAVHQILTIVLTEPVMVPPRANQRMYKLVEEPASQHDRQPRKGRAVAGVSPNSTERGAEQDDADAGLLLGMSRYSSAPVAARLGLVGAVAACAAVLAVAVIMTLWPGRAADVQPSSRGTLVAAAPPKGENPEKKPTPPTPDTVPPPTVVEDPIPKPMDKSDVPPPRPVDVPEPPKDELVKPVDPPRPGRVEIGKLESTNVLVFTRPEDGVKWLRVDAAQPITSQDELLCLPGYKADARLDTGVAVHLWGNIPDQFGATEVGARVPLEARVRIHQPAPGFQADITLLGGRIYISTKNPDGAKLRVRFASEVWDITLKDDKTDTMVELVSAFVPGTPYLRDGGELPRLSARIAVTRGVAEIVVPKRFKKSADVQGPAAFTWDSTGGAVNGPKPFERNDPSYARFVDTFIPGERGKVINQALSEFVESLKDPAGVRIMLSERLTEPADPKPVKQVACRLAVFAVPAVATGADAVDDLKSLVDVLSEETRGYARIAACDALAAWVARDPKNTAKLYELMVEKKRIPAEDADLILQLLRGFVPVRKAIPAELDKLVNLLAAKSLPIRELALWNLLNFVDPAAATVPGLVTDVARTEPEFGYDKFLAAWKARIEEVKKRPDPEAKKEPEKK